MPDSLGRCDFCPTAAHSMCCSTHRKALCHRCYRRSHFVEVCVSGCEACAAEDLPLHLRREAANGA